MSKFPPWPEVESSARILPPLGIAAVCQRAAARMGPAVGLAEEKYGREALEWMNAVSQVLRLLGAACRGEPVSRFTLDLAAEIARGTANSARIAVREHGPGPAAETAELAFAATAFAVDTLRAVEPARRAVAAVTCLKNVLASGNVPDRLIAEDWNTVQKLAAGENTDWHPSESGMFGELWPFGEPEWVTVAHARLQAVESSLPNLLRLPTP